MKLHSLLMATLCAFLLTSCFSYKKVPYLQDDHGSQRRIDRLFSFKKAPDLQDAKVVDSLQKQLSLYDAKIMPKDLLTITVNTTDPEAAAPFNLTVQSSVNVARSTSLTQQPTLQQYLVSNDGTIDFPVLGSLQISGLTKSEAENLIREKLGAYLKETPIVTVRMTNYKISVLGEVAKPGTFTVSNEKVNVLEALAMAGDMTIWGLRDNVKLVREKENGEKEIVLLDLNRADIVNSPYYYLQQNDILYVSPNKTKAKNSDIGQSTSLWVSATSILVSLASLLVTIFK